jgi:Bacteriophage T4-like portal protein (Gp20)
MAKTAKFAGYFKLINAEPTPAEITDNVAFDSVAVGNITGWYSNIVTGSGNRTAKYSEYDLMDADIEVSRALDVIAEEMSSGRGDNLISIDTEEDSLTESEHVTLKTALSRWKKSQGLDSKLFDIARQLVKYGDVFFNKPEPFSKWDYIPPKQVTGAYVNENNAAQVLGFVVNEGYRNAQHAGYNVGVKQQELVIKPVTKIIRFTLNNDMSDAAPFGKSILASVYRAYQQKKLIEDSIIIYRVQRAPEKRVFYIDVGRMPPNRAKAYLQQVKTEMRQRSIPALNNGNEATVDTVYDPQDMMEDFFLATGAEGKGSKIEVLPGGQNLGSLEDLNYFADKLNQGLRIPTSWVRDTGSGPAVVNDGKSGVAFIQELRFAKFIERLQDRLIATLDIEFKLFLKNVGIRIDQDAFFLKLPEPSNFESYRQAAKDADLLNVFASTSNIPQMSPRFAMKRFLQMTEAELSENERLLREEKGIELDDPQLLLKLYQPDAAAESGAGTGGGIDIGGGGGMGDLSLDTEEPPPDENAGGASSPPAAEEPPPEV